MIGDGFGAGSAVSTLLGPVVDQGVQSWFSTNPSEVVIISLNGAQAIGYTAISPTVANVNVPVAGTFPTTLRPLPAGQPSYSNLARFQLFAPFGVVPPNIAITPNAAYTATATGATVAAPATIVPFQVNGTQVYDISQQFNLVVPTPAAVIGTLKVAENTSPMPRDRVFVNYSYFQNVPLAAGGVNVNRLTPGFERTFFDRWASFEFRAPMATSLDSSNVVADGVTNTGKSQLGDLSLIFKSLIRRSETLAISGGVQVAVPTAPSTSVFLADGTPIAFLNNQSTHLLPFVGGLYTPNERFFAQGFIQVDVDLNGTPVSANNFIGGVSSGLQSAGTLPTPTTMLLDFGVGYWAYRNRDGIVTGIAPTIEWHGTTALVDAAAVSAAGGKILIGSPTSAYQTSSIVVGATFQFGNLTALTVGYTAPIAIGGFSPFDGEARFFFNRRFGPQSRRTRSQF